MPDVEEVDLWHVFEVFEPRQVTVDPVHSDRSMVRCPYHADRRGTHETSARTPARLLARALAWLLTDASRYEVSEEEWVLITPTGKSTGLGAVSDEWGQTAASATPRRGGRSAA